tara:strand:- start:195 stop:404 length:210 start_codon:yes stop_codon:yes gene_type:complete
MNINDLDKETAEKLGVLEMYKKAIRKPREQKFSKEQVRSNAIKVLAVVAGLNQSERERVLLHAAKLNSV